MNGRVRWSIVAVVGALGVAAVVWTICRREPITSWNSPRMIGRPKGVAGDARLVDGPVGPRTTAGTQAMLDSILSNGLSRADLRRLAATADMLPLRPKDQSVFQQEALKYMVRRLVDLGDREGLVALLSRRFPNGTVAGHAQAEYYLAYFGRKTLKDPILVLGEAYSQCRIPKVRRTIANAVRRDFSGSGVRGKDDAEFVRNAMRSVRGEEGSSVSHLRAGRRPICFLSHRTTRTTRDFRGMLSLVTWGPAVFRSEGAAGQGEEEVGSRRADGRENSLAGCCRHRRAGRRGGRLGHSAGGSR